MFAILSLHDIYSVIFSIGLSLGAGSAALSSLLLLVVMRDGRLSPDESRILKGGRVIGWVALLLYSISGVGLFTLSYEAMLALGIFRASMSIFALLVMTQLITQYYLLPKVTVAGGNKDMPHVSVLYAYAEITVLISWLFLVIHHALYRATIGMWLVLSAYFITILLVSYAYTSFLHRVLHQEKISLSYKALAVLWFLFASTLGLHFYIDQTEQATQRTHTAQSSESTETGPSIFSLHEVSTHARADDCWVIIAGDVFDVTPAADKYPDLYQCGTDITTAYHEMQPEGISERVKSYQIGSVGYTQDEVARHTTKDSCWLIIDEMVFDASPEAKLHPAAFHCGTDASVNYHRNHGATVSAKMMRLYIGRVDDGTRNVSDHAPVVTRTALAPYAELYVEAGSWDNHELMVVVEKDAEKLIFIDGSTHEVLGRIHDIGFQPHTSVYSPDARYMYIIARDGWLTKIDLTTLEPIKSISVGENSRGTALTDDGKYIAIGNYAPGNVVMLDADSLELLKTIPMVGEMNGKEIESRVGAVVQKGNDIIVALKDLSSVWVIDANNEDFTVTKKYKNIGGNQTPLHDAYLTPDGKFYLVAAMGANTVWVLDTETWQEVGEIKTGETPHTGPGATWGTTTYVPAIGEGLITAIDTTTWESIAYIKTGGPGLFVRSYPRDPAYPYVWADTAFGDHHDEIYVIDARTNEIVKTLRPVPGESSWHPEFTLDGQFVYVVSQTANEIEIYDAHDFSLVKRIEANTPSAVSNVGLRIEEPGL